jgi:hypothetical protein
MNIFDSRRMALKRRQQKIVARAEDKDITLLEF